MDLLNPATFSFLNSESLAGKRKKVSSDCMPMFSRCLMCAWASPSTWKCRLHPIIRERGRGLTTYEKEMLCLIQSFSRYYIFASFESKVLHLVIYKKIEIKGVVVHLYHAFLTDLKELFVGCEWLCTPMG